jgi:hypothetical protein
VSILPPFGTADSVFFKLSPARPMTMRLAYVNGPLPIMCVLKAHLVAQCFPHTRCWPHSGSSASSISGRQSVPAATHNNNQPEDPHTHLLLNNSLLVHFPSTKLKLAVYSSSPTVLATGVGNNKSVTSLIHCWFTKPMSYDTMGTIGSKKLCTLLSSLFRA